MKLLQFIIDLLKSIFTKDMPVSKTTEPEKPAGSEKPIDPKSSPTKSTIVPTPYVKGKYSEYELLVLQRIVDNKLDGEDLDKAIKKASNDLNRPVKNIKTKIKNMKRS